MVLVVDFYDSFTYILAHYFENGGEQVEIVFHDHLIIESLSNYSLVVLSPGPGLPAEKVNMFECIEYCQLHEVPLFGVCLGFQALALFKGGKLKNQDKVMHGVSTRLSGISPKSFLFRGVKNGSKVGLYHSWKVCNLDEKYLVAKSEADVPMALESIDDKFLGVQFHPESIMTESGMKIIENVINWKNQIIAKNRPNSLKSHTE
ncbi:MAG: aminodeoxychorismate/anthranilate synthase component II [Bacteroidetes bacterium]|nr:aminodeoxychorismate/anthranilate synthase component II [Bacteroidota bacterium]